MHNAADPRPLSLHAGGRLGPPVDAADPQPTWLHAGGRLGPPVSICTMLQTLDLRGCEQVAELGPLAACPALVDLSCDAGVPLEQIQYVQAACGSLVVWQYDYNRCHKHPPLHPAR